MRNHTIHYGDVTLDLVGSVLNMRPPLTPQPISDDKGDLLLWNGEVFGGLQVRPCIVIVHSISVFNVRMNLLEMILN